MELTLHVYKDESFAEVERTCRADRVRIPYRVGIYVAQTLDQVEDITDEKQIFKVIAGSTDQISKIVKATFRVSEAELERVDIGEMYDVAMELYRYAMEKFSSLRGPDGPNAETAAGM